MHRGHQDTGAGCECGEPTSSRRARTLTVTGLASAEQTQILTSLKVATEEYNAELLEKLLRQVDENGIRDEEVDDEDEDATTASTSGAVASAR